MTANEQVLIEKLAEELRTTNPGPLDAQADRLIRAEVASLPNAAYRLTQKAIVQGLALTQAQERIQQLEAQLRQAGFGSPGGGSFLGGGAPTGAGPAPAAAAPQSGGGVGSFLKTAAAAAAGTIGAELIYDGIRHFAAGHGGGLDAFLPGGRRDVYEINPGREVEASRGFLPVEGDVGGGGSFESDEGVVDDATEEEADDDYEDADEGGGGDWADDDSSDGGGDAGGGGDW